MFKSTSEFESAMYGILKNFRDGNANPDVLEKESDLEQIDFQDALVKAIDLRLVTGVTAQNVAGYIYYSVQKPRITYEGLSFIESFEQKSK